jgi:hypothetical protein
MSDPENTIYSDLLSELENFEQAVEQQQTEGIEEWKEKVKSVLKGAYRIRFGNLRFYEEEPELDNEVPF